MTHYHVTMNRAVNDSPALPISGDHAAMIFWSHDQAINAAEYSRRELLGQVRKNKRDGLAVSGSPERWYIEWLDGHDRHSRVIEVVPCTEELALRGADIGSDSA